jgi:hypothetical protein
MRGRPDVRGITNRRLGRTAWKHLLFALSQAFDARLVNLLLLLRRLGAVFVSGDGVLQCAQAGASGQIEVILRPHVENCLVRITNKGQQFIEYWEAGDEKAAIGTS